MPDRHAGIERKGVCKKSFQFVKHRFYMGTSKNHVHSLKTGFSLRITNKMRLCIRAPLKVSKSIRVIRGSLIVFFRQETFLKVSTIPRSVIET